MSHHHWHGGGRKSLYIGGHVHWLENMTEEESAPLIGYLYAHSQRPEFQCRFRWEQGSLAFWDNPPCQQE
jgi:taurine dioxygenase